MKINFKIKRIIAKRLSYIQQKNWIITVFIFLITFVFAVIIWQNCIFNPHPSEVTLSNILKIEQEYKTKMNVIKENNKYLEDQDIRFKNPQEELKDRHYFEPQESSDSSNQDYVPGAEVFNPQIVH